MSSTLYQLSYSLFMETIEFALTDAPNHRDDKVDPHNSKKFSLPSEEEMSLKVRLLAATLAGTISLID